MFVCSALVVSLFVPHLSHAFGAVLRDCGYSYYLIFCSVLFFEFYVSSRFAFTFSITDLFYCFTVSSRYILRSVTSFSLSL